MGFGTLFALTEGRGLSAPQVVHSWPGVLLAERTSDPERGTNDSIDRNEQQNHTGDFDCQGLDFGCQGLDSYKHKVFPPRARCSLVLAGCSLLPVGHNPPCEAVSPHYSKVEPLPNFYLRTLCHLPVSQTHSHTDPRTSTAKLASLGVPWITTFIINRVGRDRP